MAFSFKKAAKIAVNPLAVGTTLGAGKLLGLNGGGTPGYDFSGTQALISANADKRRKMTEGLYSQLPGLTANYQTSQKAAGDAFSTANTGAAKEYQTGLQGLGSEDAAARAEELKRFQTQQYRDLPQQQQAIRESLASTGNLRTGRAGTTLAQPILDTQRRISDLSSVLTQQGLSQQSARKEAGLTALYESSKGNALEKLGIDKDTARVLLDTGRSDLINKAAELSGIDQDELNAILGLQAGQVTANQNAAARKAALLGGLGSLLGAGIGGATGGGIPGAALGSTLGGQAGNIFQGLS